MRLREGGAEFAVVSRHASFIDVDVAGRRTRLAHRQGDLHFGFVEGVRAGTPYGLRAGGAFDPARGHLFDEAKLLADPLARALDRPFTWHEDLAVFGEDTAKLVPRSIVAPDLPALAPLPPWRPRFIYEVQVKAFTKLHRSVPEPLLGTVAALAHPDVIAHFKRIGCDTIELMPLAAWIDERHLARAGLRNAWGYNPVSLCAPDPRLAPGGFDEIRMAVAALHEAGLRVVLDVVLNHTGESDLGGATLSLRGLDNALYFRHAHGALVNDTGCGNTLALDRAPVMALAMDALRLWASMGIDGFRYDLATVMGRTERGFDMEAPLISAIRQDPVLRDLIHIAEPWDVGPGGYQLGAFPAEWLEWNDRYRDGVRRFWRGDAGSTADAATCLAGSSDVFGGKHRRPSSSVNFVAAHDGFTLADTVRFREKHNHANGEGNRDGNAHEISWVAQDAAGAVRDLLTTLFLSRGTAMLTAGDEFGRSQAGNNNAYAQDNETTWLDWAAADQGLIAHVAALARFRKEEAHLFHDEFIAANEAQWFGGDGLEMTEACWRKDAPRGLTLVLFIGTGRFAIATGRPAALPPARDGHDWREMRAGIPVFTEAKTGRRPAPRDETIAALAAATGVQPEWWEVNGTHHAVSLDTKRVILAGLGLLPESEAAAQAVLQRLRSLPPVEVTNAQCYLPAPLPHAFGLAAHLYALRDERDAGIGDFETLRRFAVLTKSLGGVTAGLNPLHHMFPADRKRVSPYQPSDRRFIDPIYIDVSPFAPDSKPAQILRAQRHVNYEGVWKLKSAILEKAFKVQAASQEFEEFIAAGGTALQQHAAFEARGDASRGRYAMWLQWIADRQLARAAAEGLPLGLYRDLALGCAFDGGELAANPGRFAEGVSIGAPPDPFAADGQVWNLPPFNPLKLVEEGYAAYREVLRANMRHAGILRIDHVLGLARQFWVPRGASGADGAYVHFPLEGLIRTVAEESLAARCMVIGEDLGTVPEGFRERMARANILSYRVLWFEQDASSFHPATDYPALSAACVSTHDLATFRGWREVASEADVGKLTRAAGPGDLLSAAHRFIAASPAALVLIQADDLSSEAEPLNVPGTDTERPNWRRRLGVTVGNLAARPETSSVIAAIRKERM